MKSLALILVALACASAAPDKRPPSYRPAPPAYPAPAYPAPAPAYPAPAAYKPKPAPAYRPAPEYVAAPQQQYNTYAQPKVIRILSQDFKLDDYGYAYNYETEDYQTKQETGKVIPGSKKGPYGEDEDGSLQVQGTFYYQSPEGTPITLNYRADENGFQPEGAHLPVAPDHTPEVKQATQEHLAAVAEAQSKATYQAAPSNYAPAPYAPAPAASYSRPAYRPAPY